MKLNQPLNSLHRVAYLGKFEGGEVDTKSQYEPP